MRAPNGYGSVYRMSDTYRVDKNNVASIKLAESCGLIRLPQNMIDENIREKEYVYVAGKIFEENVKKC